MDIRNWPLDKIMQLPDCCFGRRYPIVFSLLTAAIARVFRISEIGLPERCVLWEIWAYNWGGPIDGLHINTRVSFALGDQLPANAGEFDALETMFPEFDEISGDARITRVPLHLVNLRKPYFTSGRRIVVSFEPGSIDALTNTVGLIVSSIPTEVPDWLVLGKASVR